MKKTPVELNKLAAFIVDRATNEDSSESDYHPQKNPAAVALGRLGGMKGGKARAAKLSAEQRSEIAQKAAKARWGNSPGRWHSHGRGIGLDDLTSEEIKLKIENFADNDELNTYIRNYHGLFSDYCVKIGMSSTSATVIHSKRGLGRF